MSRESRVGSSKFKVSLHKIGECACRLVVILLTLNFVNDPTLNFELGLWTLASRLAFTASPSPLHSPQTLPPVHKYP